MVSGPEGSTSPPTATTATIKSPTKAPTKRRWARGTRVPLLVGTAAIGVLSLVGAGSASGTSAGTNDVTGAGVTRQSAAIVECSSGIVTDGDIQTSSMSVTPVDAAPHELPGGCRIVP